MYLNRVMLYGNLTRDPEVKALPSGIQVANFGLATNRTYKDKEGARQEQVEFHNIVAFGRSAELIAQYMHKGQPLYVEGRIQTRSWDKDGQKQYRTEIVVDNFQFGPKSAGASGGNANASSGGGKADPAAEPPAHGNKPAASGIQYPDEEIDPDDIPF